MLEMHKRIYPVLSRVSLYRLLTCMCMCMGVGCAGLVLHKHRDFRRALADLRRVVAGTTPSSPSSPSDEPAAPENLKVVWNFVGLCEANLGHVAAALQAYDQALKIDPMFKEARLNKVRIGLLWKACRHGR